MLTATSLLEAVAAVVRNAPSGVMQLASADGQIDLQFWPREQRYVCATDLARLAPGDFQRLCQIRFKASAAAEPPSATHLLDRRHKSWPWAPLLWRLAMHSGPGDLLPEIAGPVAYRVSPTLSPTGLPNNPATAALVQRLRGQPATLDELSGGTVLGRARAKRLLNGLHLQSSLIVSRLPSAAATHDVPGTSRRRDCARLCTNPWLGIVSLLLAFAQCMATAPTDEAADVGTTLHNGRLS